MNWITPEQLPAISEKAFMAQVIKLAKLLGWLTYHTHRSDRSDPGFPDLVLVRGERLIFAELKKEKGRFSTHQIMWLEWLGETSAEVYRWKPSQWKAIEEVLR